MEGKHWKGDRMRAIERIKQVNGISEAHLEIIKIIKIKMQHFRATSKLNNFQSFR